MFKFLINLFSCKCSNCGIKLSEADCRNKYCRNCFGQ